MREPPPPIDTPRHRSLSAGGFSLLEVLVALVLVAVVLVSVYRLYSQSILMDRMARFDTVAPQLARLKLAELERSAPGELQSGEGDFGSDFPGYTWRAAIEASGAEALGTPGQDLLRIDLSVALAGAAVFTLRTYRYDGSDVDIATP
ncbi:MAG: prepilin-type N-terminal cleavage/methylation domain-containing protein [Desulfobacterales bacterium]